MVTPRRKANALVLNNITKIIHVTSLINGIWSILKIYRISAPFFKGA